MIGFIKKDLMIVKANAKVGLVVLAMLLAISLQGGDAGCNRSTSDYWTDAFFQELSAMMK